MEAYFIFAIAIPVVVSIALFWMQEDVDDFNDNDKLFTARLCRFMWFFCFVNCVAATLYYHSIPGLISCTAFAFGSLSVWAIYRITYKKTILPKIFHKPKDDIGSKRHTSFKRDNLPTDSFGK